MKAKAYFQQQAQADHPSCEITALSIPLPGNNYRAVSLYVSDYETIERAENARATQLVTACGHALAEPIRGDVFVGRAHDNEALAWERDDFTSSDADATADWCRIARSSGGGGGQGGKAAASLSNLVQQQLGAAQAQGKAPPHLVAPSSVNTGLYGLDGASPVVESWGSWTQSSDEVELKLSVPAATKAKDCKITFKRNELSVAVPGTNGGTQETKIKGKLFGAIVPDDCTYTLENVAGETRELCITLTKADEDVTWSWLTVATK